MCKEKELDFSVFLLYSLANEWKKTPADVYQILDSTGILDSYIIPCYDALHTQGKEYLVGHSKRYLDFGKGFYLTTFRVLSFEKENEKWLEFVCACRRGEILNVD